MSLASHSGRPPPFNADRDNNRFEEQQLTSLVMIASVVAATNEPISSLFSLKLFKG